MKTNFFQLIADLKAPGTWKIVIHTDELGNFTVSELFTAECGDKAISKITPMNFSGSAPELDERFFPSITQPIAETAWLITNLEEHLKSIEQARLASKMEQDKKKTQSNASKTNADDIELPKISREERKKTYEDTMLKVSELRGLMKYAEAINLMPSLSDYPEKKSELEKVSADLARLQKMYDNQLFKTQENA